MGLDDVSQTSLVLGLGISEAASPILNNFKNNKKKKNNKENPTSLEFEPCALTLGFSGDVDPPPHHHPHHHHHLYRQASPHSSAVCSSFSGGGGGGIKRERDLSSEEVELERVCCRISDEDEDGCNTRKKLRLSKQQSALLEESFKQNSTLNPVSFSIYIPLLNQLYKSSIHILSFFSSETKANLSQTPKPTPKTSGSMVSK